MSLRKRISSSRESSARERAKRREERRRAARAKRAAAESKTDRKRAAKGEKPSAAKPKAETPKAEKSARREPAKPKAEEAKREKARTAKPSRDGERKRSRTGPRLRRAPGAKRPAAASPASRARRTVATDARKFAAGAGSVGAEVLKLGREMLVIPAQLWLSAAEVAGAWVLKAWLRVVRPLLLAAWRLARAFGRLVARYVTPGRAVAAVGLVAAGALAASQWLDYRSISVGSDAYSGTVGAVAPAPEVESEIAGNAHAWLMVPLAAVAVVAIVIALSGRRKVAALLVPIGLAVVVITLVVDLPKGLDEGAAAVAYEGAKANLLEGFWLQLAAAAVLIACGLLLPRYLRPLSAKEQLAATPTGPSLIDKATAFARKHTQGQAKRRLPKPRLKLPKRKVQGARL